MRKNPPWTSPLVDDKGGLTPAWLEYFQGQQDLYKQTIKAGDGSDPQNTTFGKLPASPFVGMVAYANGVDWNPGEGEGVYLYLSPKIWMLLQTVNTGVAAPASPYIGEIAYADGVNWNPGTGEGYYLYNSNGQWIPLQNFGNGHGAPLNPYPGQIVYADGSSWSPGGSGEGMYFYDHTSSWVKL